MRASCLSSRAWSRRSPWASLLHYLTALIWAKRNQIRAEDFRLGLGWWMSLRQTPPTPGLLFFWLFKWMRNMLGTEAIRERVVAQHLSTCCSRAWCWVECSAQMILKQLPYSVLWMIHEFAEDWKGKNEQIVHSCFACLMLRQKKPNLREDFVGRLFAHANKWHSHINK